MRKIISLLLILLLIYQPLFLLLNYNILHENTNIASRRDLSQIKRIKIENIEVGGGWYDPYYNLAYRWAPIIYQDTDNTNYKADYITRFDYDGDCVGNNNWDNLPNYPVPAYVYYAVMETETHYYIFYLFFHPRDWSDILPWVDEHENDMEGVWLMIRKDGTKYGSLVVMETEAHTQIYQYSNDPTVSSGSDDVDGSIIMVYAAGFERPTVFVQARGHGVYRWDGSDFPGGDGVVYYPYGRAEEPESGNDRNVSYALIPLFKTLWHYRYEIGNGETFDKPYTYQKQITYEGSTIDFVAENIPEAFDGDDGQDDAANPPWAWDDPDDGPVYKGDVFFDPAYTFSTHLTFQEQVSKNYLYHPYIKSVLKYQNEGEMEEFNPPVITITSPSDNGIYPSNVEISWSVFDDSDITKISIYVDGSLAYSYSPNSDIASSSFFINLDEGYHTINITAFDEWGNFAWKKIDIYVDATPPQLQIVHPYNNSIIYGDNVTISWDANDNTGIDHFEVKLDSGSWISISETSYFLDNLSEGDHYFYIKAIDLVGHSTVSTLKFFVKLSAPKIMFNVTNYTYFNRSSITISWKLNVTNLEGQWISFDEGSWEAYSDFEYSLNDLVEGLHSFSVKINDTGIIYTSTVYFYVDLSPPEIRSISPANESYTSEDLVIVRWESSDNYGISKRFVYYNSWQEVLNDYFELSVSQDKEVLLIKVVDFAGNSKIVRFVIYKDLELPSVEILSPNNGEKVPSKFKIRFKVMDNESGISNVSITLNGEKIFEQENIGESYEGSVSIENASAGRYIATILAIDKAGNAAKRSIEFYVVHVFAEFTYRYEFLNVSELPIKLNVSLIGQITSFKIFMNGSEFYSENLNMSSIESVTKTIDINLSKEGLWIAELVAYGPSNDDLTKASMHIIYDKTPPNLVIEKAPIGLINQSEIEISWKAKDSLSGVKKFSIKVNDSSWIPLGKNSSIKLKVEDGNYSILIKAVDYAGNERIEVVTFEVDVTPPSIEILHPKNNDFVNSTFTIRWEARDNLEIDHFEIKIDDGDWINVGNVYEYVIKLSEGRHKIVVKAVDKAGNSATARVFVFVNANEATDNISEQNLFMGQMMIVMTLLSSVITTLFIIRRRKSQA